MNTKNIKLLTVVSLLFMAGCTEDTLDDGKGLVPINLKIVVCDSTDTRAGTSLLNSFSNGDVLGIALTNCVNSSGTALSSTTYTIGTGFASQPYLKVGYTATIKGYYPSSARTATSFSVNSSQIDNSDYKASDLMYASTTASKASPSPTLTFAHKMAKIIVNVTPTNGVSSITSVTLNNINRTIGFTNSSGALGTLSNLGDIAMINNGAVLIPPQSVGEYNNFLTILTNVGIAYYKLGKTFESGKVYTLNINVGPDNIGKSTAIVGWDGSASFVNVGNPQTVVVVPQLVDLGLSVKWANMNVGATSDTDYGTYFAWGETTGFTEGRINAKTEFSWSTYRWGHASNALSKYIPRANAISYSYSGGWYDDLNILEQSDDAAYVCWGESWRMPTKEEFTELCDTRSNSDYTWTWCDGSTTKYNNSTTNGWKIMRNSTGATLFLPASGNRSGDSYSGRGGIGYYWSSTLNTSAPDCAYYLYFSDGKPSVTNFPRANGVSVRAVYDPYSITNVTSSDIGKILCSKGHIHNNKSEAESLGCVASGIIAYVHDGDTNDNIYNHGLALALTDASSGATWGTYISCVSQSDNKSTAICFKDGISCTNTVLNTCSSSHNHNAARSLLNYNIKRPFASSSWFIPSLGQWNIMLKALQGTDIHFAVYDLDNDKCQNNHVNYLISNVGGTPFDGYYWSSTECGTSGYQWYIYTSEHGSDCLILASYYWKGNSYKVRPCFAF